MDNRFFNTLASIGCSTFILGIVLLVILLIKGEFGAGIISGIVISIASFIVFIIGHESLEKNKRKYKKYIASFRPEGAPVNETRVFEPDSLLARLAVNEDTEHICLWEPENFSVKKPLKDMPFIASRYFFSEVEKVELLVNQQLSAEYPVHEVDVNVIEEPNEIKEIQLNIKAAGRMHRLLFYQIDTSLLHNPLKKGTQIYDKQISLIKDCYFLIKEFIVASNPTSRTLEKEVEVAVDRPEEIDAPSREIQIEGDPFARFAEAIHQIKEKQERLERAEELEEEHDDQIWELTGLEEGENQPEVTDTLSEFEKFLEQNKQKQHGPS
ncbi:hypothetical protein [Bacillus niameyensis]|uniref:hypothetical protein n=1 Tax=Bacillus niameyensis TaxID=1522308 RepID=UPI000782792F|nr:hypothetical protein [Bacillus niameyensis]